jgi:peptidoglycan-N-acetylglucosamine deacetylase
VKKPFKFGFQIGLFISGIIFGLLIANFSGGILTGQPAPIPKPKVTDGPEYSRRQPVSGDLVSLFPKLITRQGNSKITSLALTFDDGPDLKYTPKILDVLKKYHVKATFFVVGTQIQKYPATFRRLIREGHEVGSHSFQHLKFPELSAEQINYQLNHNNEIIRQYGGNPLKLFRPPYGALDPASIEIIGKLGYKIVLWTIDSLDWRGLKEPQVLSNVIPKLSRGDIVLQHCAADSKLEDLRGSNEALPEIIETAKSHGYRFVTISQLLEEKESPPAANQ